MSLCAQGGNCSDCVCWGRDTGGQVDIFVAPLGTGGTICGTGRYLKRQKPSMQLVAVEPEEAPFVKHGRWAPHRMMGTSPGFLPKTLEQDGNRELIDEIVLVRPSHASHKSAPCFWILARWPTCCASAWTLFVVDCDYPLLALAAFVLGERGGGFRGVPRDRTRGGLAGGN
jgi:hypothetical protein